MKQRQDHRDTLYTVDKAGNRRWVYAHYFAGKFTRIRTIVAWVLIVFYLSLPWITIGDRQGVLLDIPHRRFLFFGLEFWATDMIFLFLALTTLALSLFFFTAILGRVWCGWACPETVFLEFIFRPIERLVEGSDAERRKLDAAPWTVRKILKKGLKHLLCAGVSWIIASTTLAYFIGREPLLEMMLHSPADNLGPFFMTLALMSVMAFQFGWFREQFCTVLCPYARFQSVLMDTQSLLVGYDARRGEPRGKLRQREVPQGDCIDCRMCVRVCPTGIDIRNGTQLECIACTACVDACDSIMDRIGKPRGLIRYSNEDALNGRPFKVLRPRLFVYGGLLAGLILGFVFLLTHRQDFDIEIIRSGKSASPFTLDAAGVVTNQLSIRLSNKSAETQHYSINGVRPEVVEIVTPLAQMSIAAGQSVDIPLFVRLPKNQFRNGAVKVIADIKSARGTFARREFTVLGPQEEKR